VIETEIPMKILDIQGVSNQILGEDLPPQYCSLLQNLYERRLGELMRKGGTSQITTTFPASTDPTPIPAVTGFDNARILRKKGGSKIHVQAVSTNFLANNPANFVNLATPSFVTQAGGKWGTAVGSPANTRLDTAGYIQLQYHGYGFNFTRETLVTRGANNTLRVTVPANIDPRILGINVYSTVETWTTFGVESTMWVGYIDLNASGTRGQDYDFQMAPITQTGNPGVSGVMFGNDTKPSFTLSGATGGTLTPGKTYYVSVLEQYMSNAVGSPPIGTTFRAKEGILQSITLGPTQTAIAVAPSTTPAGDSACYCVCVGDDPQLMQPIFITNVFLNSADINYVYSLPLASPNVCGIYRVDATSQIYMWNFCDAACYDMFFRYSSAAALGTAPIYVSRTTSYNLWRTTGSISVNAYSATTAFVDIGWAPDGANYCFTQLGDMLFVVNNKASSSLTNPPIFKAADYLICDGKIAAPVVFDYGVTYTPKCSFISTFQESIVQGGGLQGSEAYNNIYFSNAYNPANFSDTGSGTNLAFVGLETAGEPVMGMGIFSITTADTGINTQFLVGTRTKLFKLNSIPDSSNFGSAYMDQLSNKVGLANHNTICQTEIGTIITGLDDVYLIRDSGEPSPIGQDIANFFKSENPAVGLNTSFWSAVYHDGHYKLSYSLPGSATPNRELWLNIIKTKANKGKPSWYGPHTGRSFHYSIVDDPLSQGDPSRRIIINIDTDSNYYADDPAYLQDFGSNIETLIEKEFIGDGGEFANKKLVRFQIRGRATGRINMESSWFADGVLLQNGVTPFVPKQNVSDILSQTTQVFPFFPVTRVRGRVLKYRLKSLTQERFGISGLLIGMRPERRRI